MTTTKATLYLLGGALEITGIFLVAAPDLAPLLRIARARIAAEGERAQAWLRRVLRRPRSVTASVSAGGAIAMGGHVSAKVSVDPAASLPDKVAFLMRRADEAQERLNLLDDRLRNEVDTRERAIASAQRETERRVREEITNALDAHKRLRLVGIGLLTLGAVLLNVGNFVA